MVLKDEWKRACQERIIFEYEVTAQKTKIADLEADRDRDIRRSSRIVRREVVDSYWEIPIYLEKRWANKRKEVAAEIQLHEVIANIDLLNEIKDGGLVVEDELA